MQSLAVGPRSSTVRCSRMLLSRLGLCLIPSTETVAVGWRGRLARFLLNHSAVGVCCDFAQGGKQYWTGGGEVGRCDLMTPDPDHGFGLF